MEKGIIEHRSCNCKGKPHTLPPLLPRPNRKPKPEPKKIEEKKDETKSS